MVDITSGKLTKFLKNHHWRREEYLRKGEVEPADNKKEFTLMRLRDQRIRELDRTYRLYYEEIRRYAGFKQLSFRSMPRLIATPRNEPLQNPNYIELEEMASGYFGKLLNKR